MGDASRKQIAESLFFLGCVVIIIGIILKSVTILLSGYLTLRCRNLIIIKFEEKIIKKLEKQ